MPSLLRHVKLVDPESGEEKPYLMGSFTTKADTQFFAQLLIPVSEQWYKITHVKDFHVFGKLLELCEQGSGRVLLTGSQRKEVMRACNMTSSHLSNSLRRLDEVGVIKRTRGEAHIDPKTAWKGTDVQRRRLLSNSLETATSTFEDETD